MGTTMTMLMIVDEKAIMAHVGASRLYLMRNGEIHQLTVDHSLANELYLAGSMSKEEAAGSRYQHVLTRCVGPQESVSVDALLFDLIPGDRMLLCSDGLSNDFESSSVVANLLAQPKIMASPEPLMQFVNASGGADNITAIVVETLADTEWVSDSEEKMASLRDNFLGQELSVRRLLHLLALTTLVNCAQLCIL